MTEQPKRPLRAIRLKCIDCMCGIAAEVRRCPCTDCTLWPFRFGRNPFHGLSRESAELKGVFDDEGAEVGNDTAEEPEAL